MVPFSGPIPKAALASNTGADENVPHPFPLPVAEGRGKGNESGNIIPHCLQTLLSLQNDPIDEFLACGTILNAADRLSGK